MPAKTTSAPSVVHPPIGTLIDDDGLELVEVLGVGGYGVVYRAVDIRSALPKSYAVKCLVHSQLQQTSRQRQIHMREIMLHQLASAHPNVVTLHRVLEDYNYTYIIMDWASDGDLFSQILYSCRYLGDDYLIKHVFLQLLDAVEYCHSLGIYHRDLKPENVLCFDGGLRIAITDFGLATTDKVSEEFRTGSVYHMSPECQGGEFAPNGSYSPMFNDIWSLGIILLNLATGRNPWKSATASDPTFQAYLRDPLVFLPTVLPISQEVNAILTRMLEVDWRDRMTLPELRLAIEDVTTFYSDGVVFEGSMARCPWEAGMDIDSDSSTKEEEEAPIATKHTEDLKSHWSSDSTSDMVFATRVAETTSSYGQWAEYSSCGATWAYESSTSSDSHPDTDMYGTPQTPPSTHSPLSPSGSDSMPRTPGSPVVDAHVPGRSLKINTDCRPPRYYARTSSVSSFSTGSSMMQTAVEYAAAYSSSFFLASPASPSKKSLGMPSSVDLGAPTEMGDNDMEAGSLWDYAATEMSFTSVYSKRNSYTNHDTLRNNPDDPEPETVIWTELHTQNVYQHNPNPVFAMMSEQLPPTPTPEPSPPPSPSPCKKPSGPKPKSSGLFSPIKFFPRSGSPPAPARGDSPPRPRHPSDPYPTQPFFRTPSPVLHPWAGFAPSRARLTPQPSHRERAHERGCRRPARLRSARHWFSPGKFFATSTAAGAPS